MNLFKCDFILVFIKFTPHIKTHFHHITKINNLRNYFLYWIECFIERGHNFSHINEMNMTHEHSNNQPMQVVELRLNVIFVKNPHPIHSLNGYINHPLIRKYSQKPINNYWRYVLKITDDYDNIAFTDCTKIKNEDSKIILKYSLLSIPSSILYFSLISLMIYTLIKPLTTDKWWWRNFYTHNIMFAVL